MLRSICLLAMLGLMLLPRSAAAQPATAQPAAAQSAAASASSASAASATRDAQTIGDIAPDRPGLGDGSGIVGRGVWQIESGWSFDSERHDGAVLHELALPLALFRVGITDRFELRVGADGLLSDTSSSPGSRRLSGRSDVEVGAKLKLIESARMGFELSLLPIVSLPIGSNAFTSGGYDPTVEFAWTQPIPRGFSLSGNVTAASVSEDDHRFTQHILTLSIDRDIAAGWNGFAEAFRASSLQRDGGAVWIVDAGATHRLGRQAQFDVSMGRGVTAAAPDWFISAGISVRGFLAHTR
jgi:Putative MetA-pathway of phenol degradation